MEEEYLGVDIGGTTINLGVIQNNLIKKEDTILINKDASKEETLQSLYQLIHENLTTRVVGIGVGVPAVVDPVKGIVYDVQNIKGWKEVNLKLLLELEFNLPVFINNDANCFALGEFMYGKNKSSNSFIGLSLGTGLGMGIVINNTLYNGVLCGAGEIGMLSYKDGIVEHYTGSFFFTDYYNETAKSLAEKAEKGDEKALNVFNEYGKHLGEAIKSILYMYAPDKIILGGSISKAFPFFKESMFNILTGYAYQKQIENLIIDVSKTKGSALLGAASLCLQNK
ncbi:ROK family protein [Formosa sediminum]|uniref:ROK family protein n=1 Tax=Formosa sediminum TaxID=2594004 RepID=A0A516GUJ7_9FLAO|nr:ROK family protein [Formosa sediminum]QDO95188.1 ROK family protein [Formosa sediminum]